MELQVRGHSRPLTPDLVALTHRRVRSALKRFELDLRRVDVRLADLNGPRGGVDQQCRVSVTFEHAGPEIVAEGTDARIEVAIDRAARRVARRLHRYRSAAGPGGRRRRAALGKAALPYPRALSG